MNLIRKHLMIEGQIEKECLVRILQEVTAIYRKYLCPMLPLSHTVETVKLSEAS